MLLAEPPRTAYDFEFQIFGFPVRVSPFFWLVSGIFGHQIALSLDEAFGNESPGVATILLVWMATVFLSILIHELGHAFTMRRFGTQASIVLYYMGGLAIPDSGGYSFLQSRRSTRGGEQIAISFAGPAAQLLLAALVILGVRFSGYQFQFEVPYVDWLVPPPAGQTIPSPGLEIVLFCLVMPSIYWALLNLLPVYPLDGGHVSREMFMSWGGPRGHYNSLIVSLVVAIVVALYFYATGSIFNAMLFISLAVSNYQLIQATRYGGGDW